MPANKALNQFCAIGLMSGSSLDGVDIAYCSFSLNPNWKDQPLIKEWEILQAETIPYPVSWQERLKTLPEQNGRTLALAHADLGHFLGKVTRDFIDRHQCKTDLIASHGHTVFHFPEEKFTTQIGDGAAIAAHTGCQVVDNLRALDVALGGQGAPIAPIADRLLLQGHDFYLNLGGIANISCNTGGKFIAFDIGGANQILNAMVQPLGLEYDNNGDIASTGKLQPELLKLANRSNYFRLPYPKSLDNKWVREKQIPIYQAYECSIADKLHTSTYQLAEQTSKAIRQIIDREQLSKTAYSLLATGGGAYNRFLINCLQHELERHFPIIVKLPDEKIIGFKEAAMVALMGVLRVNQIPNCISSVTGATRSAVGGALHQS